MQNWGVVSLIAFLVALGLLLRFGGSTNAIFGTGFRGINSWLETLTLSKWAGNNP